MAGDFFAVGALGAPGEPAELRHNRVHGHGQAGRRLVGGQPHELSLDDAVLERVIGQHDDAAAAPAQSSAAGSDRRSVPSSSLTSIHRAWKVRFGRVPPGAPGGRRDHVLDDRAQPLCRGDRGRTGLMSHALGNPPGRTTTCAVIAQDPGGFFGHRVAVDHIGGGSVLAAVHPPCRGGVLGVGEAALGVIELRGEDTPRSKSGPVTTLSGPMVPALVAAVTMAGISSYLACTRVTRAA